MSKTPAKNLIPLLLLTFTVAGVIGFIYETVCVLINTGGEFFKRGTTYGPWIPIYGFGALLIYALTVKFRKKPWLVFLIAMTPERLYLRQIGPHLGHLRHAPDVWPASARREVPKEAPQGI